MNSQLKIAHIKKDKDDSARLLWEQVLKPKWKEKFKKKAEIELKVRNEK